MRSVLNNRFKIEETNGLLCNAEVETVENRFVYCPITRIVWSMSPWQLNETHINRSMDQANIASTEITPSPKKKPPS